MYNIDPKTFLWMVEQDRERTMTQHALERAARSGGEQRPGLARGGISYVARFLRRAGSVATNPDAGASRPTSQLSGPAAV
jgi:hypothetical protein